MQELKPGTKVLVENTYQKERKGGKLEDKYKGPYKINKSLGKGVYELINSNGKILKSKHNITRLKVYANLYCACYGYTMILHMYACRFTENVPR